MIFLLFFAFFRKSSKPWPQFLEAFFLRLGAKIIRGAPDAWRFVIVVVEFGVTETDASLRRIKLSACEFSPQPPNPCKTSPKSDARILRHLERRLKSDDSVLVMFFRGPKIKKCFFAHWEVNLQKTLGDSDIYVKFCKTYSKTGVHTFL